MIARVHTSTNTNVSTFTPAAPGAVNHLREARRERELAVLADIDLRETLVGARGFLGPTVGDALHRAVEPVVDGYDAACARFEQAIERLEETNDQLQAECADRGRQITELAADLAQARSMVVLWQNAESQATDERDALRFVLRRAVSWARGWSSKKKGRRVPGFVKAAEILLDGGDD